MAHSEPAPLQQFLWGARLTALPRQHFLSLCLPCQGHEPVMRPLSEVLGSDAPRLQVQGSSSGLERSISAVSSTAG